MKKNIDKEEFNNRVSALRFYIRSLQELETLLEIDRTNVHGKYLKNEIDHLERKHRSADLIEILKANAYMMMYNLVEDTVRRIVKYIYSSINSENLSFKDFNETYRKLIREYTYNLKENPSSKKVAERSNELISNILTDEKMNFLFKKFSLSGNANMKAIKKICDSHDIPITDRFIVRYSHQLDDAKTIRNCLAHGDRSFVAATRNKTIDDTYRCVQDIVTFLRYLMKNAEKLINEKRYLAIHSTN